MKTEELSRRDLMKWGGAAVASISLGTLESIISGCRDTRNTTDMIYESENPPLLVNLTGTATTGYTGTLTLGIQTGQIFGG